MTDTLDLTALASAADVTVRTVRYYIQQGLLPAPGVRGPLTRYTPGHLDRLRLIRQLQREHLPLSEIRKQLEALDDGAVRRALAAKPKKKAPRSAAEYVRDVLAKSGGRQLESAVLREEPVSRPGPMAYASPVNPDRVSGPGGGMETRSTWDHIALSPDIELHVRRPLSREQNRQLERLLHAAREIMSEDR